MLRPMTQPVTQSLTQDELNGILASRVTAFPFTVMETEAM